MFIHTLSTDTPMSEVLEARLQRIRMERRRLVESSRSWVNIDAASRRIDALWVEEVAIKLALKKLEPTPNPHIEVLA
jgi:hypothetical protein